MFFKDKRKKPATLGDKKFMVRISLCSITKEYLSNQTVRIFSSEKQRKKYTMFFLLCCNFYGFADEMDSHWEGYIIKLVQVLDFFLLG